MTASATFENYTTLTDVTWERRIPSRRSIAAGLAPRLQLDRLRAAQALP